MNFCRDLTRPQPKKWLKKGMPLICLISGKSRLVNIIFGQTDLLTFFSPNFLHGFLSDKIMSYFQDLLMLVIVTKPMTQKKYEASF